MDWISPQVWRGAMDLALLSAPATRCRNHPTPEASRKELPSSISPRLRQAAGITGGRRSNMVSRVCCLALAAGAAALIAWSASRPAEIVFERQMIDPGASETAAVADINGDGKLDIVSGEYWYAG